MYVGGLVFAAVINATFNQEFIGQTWKNLKTWIFPVEPVLIPPPVPQVAPPLGDFQFGDQLEEVMAAMGKSVDHVSSEWSNEDTLSVKGRIQTLAGPAHLQGVSQPLRATYGFWGGDLTYMRFEHQCSGANGAPACKAECDVIAAKAQSWFETEVGAPFQFPAEGTPNNSSSTFEKDPSDPIKRETDRITGITYEEREMIWEDVLTASAAHDPYSIAVTASKKLYFTEILGSDHGGATPGLIQRDGMKRDEIGEGVCNAKIEVAKRAE
ncbi:hypothetical protein AYJ57_21195 (plasmid) [Salipiger sp. CCB-MM3]|uniref:hypothetical protein n=1 Tax=Salipiger sp. CCB-MM3 TaxID=1792508 RepID=UPI00080AC04B|nr:hypothetical protein [Salipiger sp. CCB-MM3]ANT62995.1 hypothetical protein AYJ57_21195 [Salipiger sp. CCB-MM3]